MPVILSLKKMAIHEKLQPLNNKCAIFRKHKGHYQVI